jgi:hypothetical protein
MADASAASQEQQQQQEQCTDHESSEQQKSVQAYYRSRDQKEQCLHIAAAKHAHDLSEAAREAFADAWKWRA